MLRACMHAEKTNTQVKSERTENEQSQNVIAGPTIRHKRGDCLRLLSEEHSRGPGFALRQRVEYNKTAEPRL